MRSISCQERPKAHCAAAQRIQITNGCGTERGGPQPRSGALLLQRLSTANSLQLCMCVYAYTLLAFVQRAVVRIFSGCYTVAAWHWRFQIVDCRLLPVDAEKVFFAHFKSNGIKCLRSRLRCSTPKWAHDAEVANAHQVIIIIIIHRLFPPYQHSYHLDRRCCPAHSSSRNFALLFAQTQWQQCKEYVCKLLAVPLWRLVFSILRFPPKVRGLHMRTVSFAWRWPGWVAYLCICANCICTYLFARSQRVICV